MTDSLRDVATGANVRMLQYIKRDQEKRDREYERHARINTMGAFLERLEESIMESRNLRHISLPELKEAFHLLAELIRADAEADAKIRQTDAIVDLLERMG